MVADYLDSRTQILCQHRMGKTRPLESTFPNFENSLEGFIRFDN